MRLTDGGRGSPNKSQSSHRRREINAGLLIRRPLGCGECLAGKDSLARRLTLIHWTLIRMASPGLDASVVTLSLCLSSRDAPLVLLRQFWLLYLSLCFYPSRCQVKLNTFARLVATARKREEGATARLLVPCMFHRFGFFLFFTLFYY